MHDWRAHVRLARLKVQVEETIQGAQLRQLRHILARSRGGTISGCVAVWREGTTDAVGAGYMAMLREMRSNSFLATIRHTLCRIARGEACARLYLWRDQTRQAALSGWVRAVDERQARLRQSTAVRQMKQIWCRMLKGETALRLCIWRQEVRPPRCLLVYVVVVCWEPLARCLNAPNEA